MSLNRTTHTEQQTEFNFDEVITQLDVRQQLAVKLKNNRYRASKLEPYREKILGLYHRDQSLERIKLALSSGLLGPKFKAGRTTIHDFIKSHLEK